MAERRRGLGRGLGSLIPSGDDVGRPVDVFFPQEERERAEQADAQQDESAATKKRSSDPAESMRIARSTKKKPARKPAGSSTAKAAAETAPATGGDGDDAAEKTKSASSRSGARKASTKSAGAAKSTSGSSAKAARKAASGKAATPPPSEHEQIDEGPELVPVPGATFAYLPLDAIVPNPRQPRTVFDEDALAELVHSIKEIGVLQPVVVRQTEQTPPKFELIMGERRFRASREAGLEAVPAIIRSVSDEDLLRDALLENLHRSDLNPLEEAAAYQQLLEDFGCTQEELSERIGRSRPQISNTLRLLRLPPMVQRRVAAGVLSHGHARAILGLKDAAQMEVLAQRVVAEGLSVRATEEAVVLLNRGDAVSVSRGTRRVNPELESLARSIGDRLDTRVNVTMGKRKGKISVEFANQEDLDRILSLLGVER